MSLANCKTPVDWENEVRNFAFLTFFLHYLKLACQNFEGLTPLDKLASRGAGELFYVLFHVCVLSIASFPNPNWYWCKVIWFIGDRLPTFVCRDCYPKPQLLAKRRRSVVPDPETVYYMFGR